MYWARHASLLTTILLFGCEGAGGADAGAARDGAIPEPSDAGSIDAGSLHAGSDAAARDGGRADAASSDVSPDAGPADPCAALAGDPRVLPAGFTRHDVPWERAFFDHSYPSSGAPLAPIGSFTLRSDGDTGPTMTGRYLTIPFVPGSASYQLEWTRAQPIAAYGYGIARVAPSLYLTVSRCPGDFRDVVEGSADPALRPACRKTASQGSLFYSSTTPGPNTCMVTAGETHYINIVFADPSTGLSATETTCAASGDRCEINAEHRER